MGLLVEGQCQDKWYDTATSGGRFQRFASLFRNWITPDGSGCPEGRGGYHLYVSLACPWAHRTQLMHQLKGLSQLIPVSVVHQLMLENGWTFSQDFPGAPLFDKAFLYQLYLQANPGYSDRVTAPVLWDKQQQTIVSNESAEEVFTALARLEEILGRHRYLTGPRLWTTLIRFDAVYHTHFKCDRQRLSDYLKLSGFLRDIISCRHCRNGRFRPYSLPLFPQSSDPQSAWHYFNRTAVRSWRTPRPRAAFRRPRGVTRRPPDGGSWRFS